MSILANELLIDRSVQSVPPIERTGRIDTERQTDNE